MKPTNTGGHDYYHKVVDCQWACPAHTPVPEYIRLIAGGRYSDAYMINWRSNVFPGILGRVCDRPCEPACRRGRIDKDPVAICRLKRVAADLKDDIAEYMPKVPKKNGKRVACIGAGPASLTVARDLAVQGYDVTIFDSGKAPGGMVRTQIPKFRLPDSVIDEECQYILDLGVNLRLNHWVKSLKSLVDDAQWDAVFVGTGAPRGRDADIPGRKEAASHIHIGIEWLANVAFGHVKTVSPRVIVLGGGNTAMDCCRSARRLGGTDVKVVVRSSFEEMKASPWEKEEAIHEQIPIINMHVPKEFVHDNGKLTGVKFEVVRAEYDSQGRRSLVPSGEPDVFLECDEVLVAIGQENAFPWIEKDIGLEFNKYGLPVLDKETFQSTVPKVFFGGDSAFGPKNIITAVAHGHAAAISIDLFCKGLRVDERPAPLYNLVSQKMGIHEWSYDNQVSEEGRKKVPMKSLEKTLTDIKLELELGFDPFMACSEAERCLNCDVETVFSPKVCIECDACTDICPTECISFTGNGEEEDLRGRLKAPAKNTEQALLVSDILKTGRVMVKDENICLHCGMCAERCPTGAWDMQKFTLHSAQAGMEVPRT
ncbi:FAD-dependent oxidoreductase [Propionivibrio dicarboxylicus]|uniref:NADPH-dependent glutamate synthase beta chain n=1 Tax=Propionivibrio dicarboxylicus TaxID=83767 RepID=A0A1G8LPK7_9RHOO|nr:FAD-dependent oxidoreductase [Propionivibrio dicarboxylicus]SDI57565.1 NADPH-dependent glutamate synthase beta chain [Propionivibrio dicarboxylicus]